MATIASRIEASESAMKRIGQGMDSMTSRLDSVESRLLDIAKQVKDNDARIRLVEVRTHKDATK